MISPNRPVIMDATSTMSSNSTIERNDRPERMYNGMSDSRDEITERELLEDPNQDPDDEDTLSDDSLRLRVSDDEADISQSGLTFDLATPCCSSKQTTSQDSATGLTESDEKKPSLTETSHSIHDSCESGSNEEYQSPKDPIQILDETCNDSEKNMNRMWRDKGRRERPIDLVHSPNQVLTSSAGYSFYAQYNFGSSNSRKNLSYFNNQDNFGKPSGHRKHESYRKYAMGKRVHDSKQNSPLGIDEEKTQTSVPLSRSKSQMRSEADSDQSSHAPSNTTSEKTEDLSNVNNESSKECSTVNYDQESKNSPKTLADFCAKIDDRKAIGNVSSSNCDIKFASSDSADVESIVSMEQCTETSSSVPNQDPSDSRAMTLTPLPEDTEPTDSLSQETKTAIDNVPLSQHSSVDSPDAKEQTTESDVGINLNVAEPMSDDTDANALHVAEKEVDVNNHIAEPSEELIKVIDSSDTSNDLGFDLKPCHPKADEKNLDEKSVSNDQHSIVNEDLEIKRLLNNGNEDKHSDDKDDGKNEENVKEKQTKNLLLNSQEVTEEASKIVIDDKESGDNEEDVTTDNKRKLSLHNEETELIEHLLQKSKILKNANEILRNHLVCSETSVNSSDNNGHNVTNKNNSPKLDGVVESQRQNVMKRSLPDIESVTDQSIHKKMRITPHPAPKVCSEQLQSLISIDSTTDEKETMSAEKSNDTSKPLRYVRKFFQRNMKGKLTKLKREELEELIIQKLVETITMRSEIGRLREQARISERNQEATRIRCQQLSKQIKDFDMVLSRNAADRRLNNDKPVPPIKINRSVGLQVNFMTDPAIQSLKTLTTNNVVKTNVPNPVTVNGGNTSAISDSTGKITATPRRGIKVRSPRRAEVAKNSSLLTPPLTSTATPTALVVTKPVDTFHNLPTPINSKEQGLSNVNTVQPAAAKVQAIVINGKTSNQVNRHTSVPNNHIADSSDLIDLTEEEDKNKSISHTTTGILPMVGTVTTSIATKVPQGRFQRVVQGTLPGNVAITTQPANIRVVQSVGQPTPTALVNNINTARLAYVMQGPTGAGRQLLISAANPHQIRPATSTVRSQFSNMAYKTGISTLANGTVRLLTTAASPASTSHIPAPLPKTPHYQQKNGWKLPPPPPSVKISKVGQDIVLSWNMAPLADHAEIASYQLYAYQEIPGAAPNPNLWKKVGDVRALPLPMACTLKEFTPGNNYHFAVRAVDVHSRMGLYSIPRNISL